MDVARRLKDSGGAATVDRGVACPRCGEAAGALAPVTCHAFERTGLARCTRCGTRRTHGDRLPRLVFTCESCGVPFLAQEILPHDEQRCDDCRAGELPPELPAAEIAAATESEIRQALDGRWGFVTAPVAQPYLDRIARHVAARIEGATDDARVVLFLDPVHRSLALPSGTLLVSTGLLAFLEDESELVFVLGHEIAHAACGDAAVRLSRLGFAASVRRRSDDSDESWAEAAMDLVRLGYGRRRERDADTRAAEAVAVLGYDPESISRYLARCAAAIAKGDPALAECALAHPPAADRAMRIERALYGRVGPVGTPKVNRELFRRALRHDALPEQFVPVRLGQLALPVAAPAPNWPRRVAVGLGVLALAGAAMAGLVYLLR